MGLMVTGNRMVTRYVARGMRFEGKQDGTEATETRLETCQRGLRSYKSVRAVKPVNIPLMMAVMMLEYKYL